VELLLLPPLTNYALQKGISIRKLRSIPLIKTCENERNRNHKQKLNRFISDYHLIDAVARNLNAICGRTAHWIPNEVSASIEVQVYIYTWRVVLLFWLVLAQNINHLVFCV
jgi:hypothetical protein